MFVLCDSISQCTSIALCSYFFREDSQHLCLAWFQYVNCICKCIYALQWCLCFSGAYCGCLAYPLPKPEPWSPALLAGTTCLSSPWASNEIHIACWVSYNCHTAHCCSRTRSPWPRSHSTALIGQTYLILETGTPVDIFVARKIEETWTPNLP